MKETPPGRSRRALGRGLDALLPSGPQGGLREVDVDRIDANPSQPRRKFDLVALEELAESIRQHGIVQPPVVCAVGDDRYRLIVGERRWQAAKFAGLQRIPVIVKDVSDKQTLEIALVENVQRSDLNPLEEATAYQRLVEEFGLTQQEIAGQVGKSRAAIANTLRLLSLSDVLKAAVTDDRISEGHARALLGITDEAIQIAALKRVERDGLSVRQTEDLVRNVTSARRMIRQAPKSPDIEAVENDLRRALGTKVSLHRARRGGRIVIEYYSDEEFQGLYDRLVDLGRP